VLAAVHLAHHRILQLDRAEVPPQHLEALMQGRGDVTDRKPDLLKAMNVRECFGSILADYNRPVESQSTLKQPRFVHNVLPRTQLTLACFIFSCMEQESKVRAVEHIG